MINRSTIHALLIDRNRKDCFVMRNLLSDSDPLCPKCQLDCAESVEEGLECLTREAIDIIFLDVTLSFEENIQSLFRLQNQVHGIPIVVLTTPEQIQNAIEAVNHGAESYILKDRFNSQLLTQTILNAIEHFKMRQELNAVTADLTSANLKLRKFTLFDPLTELFNQRGLEQVFLKEIEWFKRNSAYQLVALLIDLDRFKDVNHTLGHAIGDNALRELAVRLKSMFRPHDAVARLGGDEFMVLLPETSVEEGLKAAERVRLAISGTPLLLSPGKAISVTASVGVIEIPKTISSVDELISRMHVLLDKIKVKGANAIVAFSEHQALDEKHSTQLISNVLKAFCSDNCFRALKQPIFHLSDQQLVGFEFLSRSAVRGFEMPDDFFRLSFENHLLTYVDHQCFKACVALASQLPNHLKRHVNLFPSTILNIPITHLLDTFEMGESPESYCIELSEQQMISDPVYLVEALKTLRSYGVKIAIDDVGFGRSCLENLILLEPDVLKIDRKCVSSLRTNTPKAKSLQKILDVAKALGAEVVAEGIENAEELQSLVELGVEFGQGYFLGKPA